MPAPKIPSIEELMERSDEMGEEAFAAWLLTQPAPVLDLIKAQGQTAVQLMGAGAVVPATPTEMALLNPKFQWMNARHLFFLGLALAEVIERNKSEGVSEGLIVAMPPRHAKSHTCSVWTPFWYLAKYPEDPVFLISHSDLKARAWGVMVRRLVELYGEPYGLRINPRKSSGSDWELESGGGMKTVGRGGSISGNPAKLLIADDVLKDQKEAESETLRESVWDWWTSTVLQRIEPDTTFIGIGTRYHEDDIIGRIIKASEDGTGLQVAQITMAAIAEAEDPQKGIGPDPLDRSPGDTLWPEHFKESFYTKRRDAVSLYTWSSVYQQRPTPPGGNLFDPAWWRFCKPSEVPAFVQGDMEAQSWDLALDAEKKGDSYMAGGTGLRHNALVYVRDLFHEYCDTDKVMSQMVVWKNGYPNTQYQLVERSLAGPMMITTMRHKVTGMLPWPPKGTQKGSKFANANACVPVVRSGNVIIVINEDGTKPKIVDDFIEELRQFPRAPHDDFVDMFTQLLAFLLPAVFRSLMDMDKAHEDAKAADDPATPANIHREGLHNLIKAQADLRKKAVAKQMKKADRDLSGVSKVLTGIADRDPRTSGKVRTSRRMW